MDKFKVLDLFSGIGGFSLGLERTGGFKTAAFCEIEEFPRKVLNKHWPGVPIYEDIRELTAERLLSDGIRPDVITGGFPCQDVSMSGLRNGIDGKRTGLYSEAVRIISEIRPRFALLENVTGILTSGFGRLLAALHEIGYDTEWQSIYASSVGAIQGRDRVWIIAYPQSFRSQSIFLESKLFQKAFEYSARSASNIGSYYCENAERFLREDQSGICRVSDDVSARVDRLKGLGNAVVPQIPELIGRAILEAEHGGMCE